MTKVILNRQQDGKLAGKKLEHLFWAYFNNKMTVLLMLIEHPVIARRALSPEKQKAFLFDLYHHFLPSDSDRKYHHAFRWLERFLNQYPEVHYREIAKAIQMVALIYEAFGRKLHPRLEAIRLEREQLD